MRRLMRIPSFWILISAIIITLSTVVVKRLLSPSPLSIPKQILPIPNAYDDYALAAQVIRDEKEITSMNTSVSRQRSIIVNNANTLRLFHKGLNHSFCYPRKSGLNGKLYGEHAYTLARLILIEEWLYQIDNNYSSASKSALNALKYGSQLNHSSPLNVCTVSLIIQLNVMKIISRDLIDHLGIVDTKYAINMMKNICSEQITVPDCLQDMYWLDITEATYIMGKYHNKDSSLPIAITKKMLAQYKNYMDTAIKTVQCPYIHQHRLSKPPAIVMQCFFPNDSFTFFQSLPFNMIRCQTHARLLLVDLALHAYRLEHDTLPERLDQLVPTYLTKLPEDPFQYKKYFHYLKQGKQFLLYSNGPDGYDNNGRPIYHKLEDTDDTRCRVTEDSKGDFVETQNW